MAIDWDLWLRLSLTWNLDFVEAPLIRYRLGHPGQMSKSVKVRQSNADLIRQRFLAENPGIFSASTRRRADAYRFVCRGYVLRSVDLPESTHYYVSSIRCWPFSPTGYKGLMRNLWLQYRAGSRTAA